MATEMFKNIILKNLLKREAAVIFMSKHEFQRYLLFLPLLWIKSCSCPTLVTLKSWSCLGFDNNNKHIFARLCEAEDCGTAVCARRPTVARMLEGRGELLGRDPRHATLVLGFLRRSHRRLRLPLRMSRPETRGKREMKFICISGSERRLAETRQSRRWQSTQQIQSQVWSQTMTTVFSFQLLQSLQEYTSSSWR